MRTLGFLLSSSILVCDYFLVTFDSDWSSFLAECFGCWSWVYDSDFLSCIVDVTRVMYLSGDMIYRVLSSIFAATGTECLRTETLAKRESNAAAVRSHYRHSQNR